MDTRPHFDVEKAALVEKATQELEKLIRNLNRLNQNLEIVNTIGKEFNEPSEVWHKFHNALKEPCSNRTDSAEAMDVDHHDKRANNQSSEVNNQKRPISVNDDYIQWFLWTLTKDNGHCWTTDRRFAFSFRVKLSVELSTAFIFPTMQPDVPDLSRPSIYRGFLHNR
ncbi:hypothetical protein BX666DRAFT_2028388 [Dichotomocladium elegans]|nr:hypothetical protein BX666DRAFT_2028388 [Dichotomocladium elegans]